MAERRYSLVDLVEAMRLEVGASVTRALNISGQQLERYALHGMERNTAERLAERAGFIPYEVWPDLLLDLIAEQERECAADDCTERFIPGWRGGQNRVYCSPRCGARMHMRRYRQTEEGKRKNREYVAAYKAWVRQRRAS